MESTEELKSVFWIGTFLMLFLAFGLVFLVVSYQRHFFKMKKKEAELMLLACLETEKKERMRIAADLHDSVSGDLSAIRNYINILGKNKADENHEIFMEIKSGVDAALENTRAISYNLMPPLLETKGLVEALRNFFEGTARKTAIVFTINADNLQLHPSVSYHLFRIMQEFTTNMVKYGNVKNVDLSFAKENEVLKIEIKDNGTAFDFMHFLKESTGSGIMNINSRIKAIDAVLVQNKIEKGNHFIITLKNTHD